MRLVLLDNDVVLKACAWDLGDEALDALGGPGCASCLGVARFSMPNRMRRWRSLSVTQSALARLERLMAVVGSVEPDRAEIVAAADMEEAALRAGLELDAGESQLAAIASARSCAALVTGDKRAIIALAAVASADLYGRVACLEQLLATLCSILGCETVRGRVCAEPSADRAAALAFSCGGGGEPDPIAALTSYVEHLRALAPLLAPGLVLTPVVLEEDRVGRP